MTTSIELRNHLHQYETVELAPGTTELSFPGNIRIVGGSLPNHVHQYDKPAWTNVAVFVRPQECPRCPQ